MKNYLQLIKQQVKNILHIEEKTILIRYCKKYFKYSFEETNCNFVQQYEASITRYYHMIEKGLAYKEYRPGFGIDNINNLITLMEKYYKTGGDTSEFFYETALSTLNEYLIKNKEYGYKDKTIEERVSSLPGKRNGFGGTIKFKIADTKNMNYEELVSYRHSVRHFSDKPIDVKFVDEAVALAQHTPSACNRQGWKCYIIQDKKKIKELLKYQNGNRGFGQEFDKLILVVGDLRFFHKSREVFQVYIDGGMYAMRVLDSLCFKSIAACPLSASLTSDQEKQVRRVLNLDDAEVPIMYIGVGNYVEGTNQTTRSERHKPYTIVI